MGDDNTRNKPVTIYYTADEKAAIEREAEDAGKTVSTYCRQIIDRSRRADDLEELDAEARLDRLMAEGVDRIEEIGEDIREQNGLVIHLLREIESQLEGVDVDDLQGDENSDPDDLENDDGPKGVDDLI